MSVNQWVKRARVQATPVAVYTIRWVAFTTMVFGFAMAVGGPNKWSYKTYAVLRAFPGAPGSWGAILFLFGLSILVGSLIARRHRWALWLRNAGFVLGAIWWATFGWCILAVVTVSNEVPYSGPALCLMPFGLYLLLTLINEREPYDAEETG